MPTVSDEHKKLQESLGFIPKVSNSNLSPDQLRSLFYTSTTKSTYVPKQLEFNPSFNQVHKVEQHSRISHESHAPFWSRSMCRYQMSYVPLPLEGAAINRELANTFRPLNMAAVVSVPLRGETRYKEIFRAPNKMTRSASMRPAQTRHVRPDDHLLIVDSVTHQQFQPFEAKFIHPPEPIKSEIPKPTKANAGHKFEGITRYEEEYEPVAQQSLRGFARPGDSASSSEPVFGTKVVYEDNSSRVWGNSIPNKVRNYLFQADAFDANSGALKSDIQPLTQVLVDPKPVPTVRVASPLNDASRAKIDAAVKANAVLH